MSAKTPRYQLEFPTISDRVADAPAINQRAMTRVEDTLAALSDRLQTGSVALGNLNPGEATNTYTVVFPRPFKTQPKVFMQSENQRLNTAAWDISATGFKWMAFNNTSGTSAFASLMWLAVAI